MSKVRVQPVENRSLARIVAGRLAALILEGKLKEGEQLPSERQLVAQLEVSRSTLREGLKILAQNRLIEVRPGVGSFVRPLDRSNYAQAIELAGDHRTPPISDPPKFAVDAAPLIVVPKIEQGMAGEPPRALKVKSEKPLRVPNLKKDRLGTFDLMSWWERDQVQSAKIMIVGAGALGNEVLKNLSLMGVGRLFIVDFDEIEAANLSRSVLFRERDEGRSKAEVAAARIKELNPDIRIQYASLDVTTQLGLGVFRRMDAVVGCLDNREARLAINRFCNWVGIPWVDGAIQELLGLARVFVPGDGACYECTLTEQARREMSLRYSCPLLARHNILVGKVPTTPTIASIIAGIQSQEALKLVHGLPVESGHVVHFNGMTNHMHTTAYSIRDDCESHWRYGEIDELPFRAENTTLKEMLEIARADLGPDAFLELDQELVLSLECSQCATTDEIMQPITKVSEEAGRCPTCGLMRTVHMSHVITGEETFLERTLLSVGVPPLHVLRAQNGVEYRFYELTGDLPEALHFRHYQGPASTANEQAQLDIRLGPETELSSEDRDNPAFGRVVIKE